MEAKKRIYNISVHVLMKVTITYTYIHTQFFFCNNIHHHLIARAVFIFSIS